MARPIKNDVEAVKVAAKIIAAQDRLLFAYRSGSPRAPGTAIDILRKQRPRFDTYISAEQEVK